MIDDLKAGTRRKLSAEQGDLSREIVNHQS
jgi:hypothetical protein